MANGSAANNQCLSFDLGVEQRVKELLAVQGLSEDEIAEALADAKERDAAERRRAMPATKGDIDAVIQRLVGFEEMLRGMGK